MIVSERLIEHLYGLVLINGNRESDADDVVHRLVGNADRMLGHKTQILATHSETELKNLVGSHIHKLRHLERTDITLFLVDVIVLEADSVLVYPNSLSFQRRREIEGFGGNRLAIFHFQAFRIAETHHNGLASDDGTRSVAVQKGQQRFIQRADTLHKHVRPNCPLLTARGGEGQQQHRENQADATDFFHF